MANTWQLATHHLAPASSGVARRLAVASRATHYKGTLYKPTQFETRIKLYAHSLLPLTASSHSSFQRGSTLFFPRAINSHVGSRHVSYPSSSVLSVVSASSSASGGGGEGANGGSGSGSSSSNRQPSSSNSPDSGAPVRGTPKVPLLVFSPSGQLSLTAQRPPADSAPPSPSPSSSSAKPSASPPKSTASGSGASASSGASSSSPPRTRAAKPPGTPTSAPRYSKAARRFFNERFRSAEREAAQRGQRLSKVLAAAGVASRRACEEIIFAGRVTVNGNKCTVPQTAVDPMKDNIYVDGKSLPRKAPPRLYFMVNKPKGYICSNAPNASQTEASSPPSSSPQSSKPPSRDSKSGAKGRSGRVEGSGFNGKSGGNVSSGGGGGGSDGGSVEKTAVGLIEDYLKVWERRNPGIPRPRLFTVGRLDVQTTGLLLVTNDGNFAQQVAHPSAGLTKEYVVTVQGPITKRQLATMAAGTDIDGVHCTPVALELVTEGDTKGGGGGGGGGGNGRERVRVVVAEGRNREVRRLAEASGMEVLGLKRVRIGSLRLPRDLGVGKYKALKSTDVERLLKERM